MRSAGLAGMLRAKRLQAAAAGPARNAAQRGGSRSAHLLRRSRAALLLLRLLRELVHQLLRLGCELVQQPHGCETHADDELEENPW